MTLQTQLHRRQRPLLSTCHRHPTPAPITGFCPSCLRERLAGIEDNCPTPSTSHLRRSKSCSGGPLPSSSSSASEHRRKSCDARAHSTLNDLFAIDDDKIQTLYFNHPPSKAEAVFQVSDEEEGGELKTMKEFIDLELGSSSKQTSGKSIWEAASVFSKRLKDWRKKQGKKKDKNVGSVLDRTNKRETQSEIGEYGLFGRRSCDTDPRLSVDIGRLSVDDSRFSYDEPRASWDGCLIRKQKPNVNEEADAGEDRLGVVKEEERFSPGGSTQTRDFYADSLTTRRKMEQNAELSPGPRDIGLFHGAKLLVTEKELRDSNWYSNVESGSKDVEFVAASGVGQKGFTFKKGKGWRNVLSIWGLIQRPKQSEFVHEDKTVGGYAGDGRPAESFQKFTRVANGDEDRAIRGNVSEATLAESLQKLRGLANGDEGKVVGGNVADHPTLAESLQKLRKVANGDLNGSVANHTLMRNCSVSARNSVDGSSCYGMSMLESNSKGEGEKRRDNFMMQQNNGLLRFYLTPLRSYRRSKSGKSKLRNSNSVVMDKRLNLS